jgi:predicted 3-demethylubiquinone-9 3-methyltransferase (glyoxalase superfamily)
MFQNADAEETMDLSVVLSGDRGAVLMPLNNYGFSTLFTWLNDRFGVSWQLDLASACRN